VAFEVFYENKIKTNGGWMYDILVSKDDKETRHRVVCGRIYPEAVNMPEDIFLERVFGFLLVSADFVSSRCFVLYFALQSHLGLACQ
jgi:hypothetical protein